MAKTSKPWDNHTKAACGAGQFMRDHDGRVWFIHSKNDAAAIGQKIAMGWAIVSPEVALAEEKAAQNPAPVVAAEPSVVEAPAPARPSKK